MKQIIKWVTRNPMVSRVFGVASKIGGPIGTIFSTTGILKSIDKKNDLYWNAGMSEAQANANAAADTLREGAINVFNPQTGPIGNIAKSMTKWIAQKVSRETATNKTIENFYKSQSSNITVKDPIIKYADGKSQSVKGNIQLEHLQDIQNVPNSDFKMGADDMLHGRVEENVYLKQFNDNVNLDISSKGLSNSSNVANTLIKTPDPSLITAQNSYLQSLQILGQLGQTTSVGSAIFGMISGLAGAVLGGALSSALGGAISSALKSGVPTGVGNSITTPNFSLDTSAIILRHSGGVVPGQGEVPAILMGGETVRTKPQEEELQQQLYQKYIGDFAPTVCGEQQQATRQQQNNTGNNPQKPIYQQITKDDEMFILNLIADAIDRNRMGLRTKMQAL